MIRKILAVIIGYIIFAASGLAFFHYLKIDAHGTATTEILVKTAINGIIFSVISGLITQLISNSKNLKINYILAILIAAFAIFSYFKSSGEHWTQLMAIFVFAPISILGGWLIIKKEIKKQLMEKVSEIHPDFLNFLKFKEPSLIELFTDLRSFILELHPNSNELLYHTHALTSVFSISEQLGDAFCMITIYTSHLNLGFNKGTLLSDPNQLLMGTGNLIRHIPIKEKSDYRNEKVKALVIEAINFAIKDMAKPTNSTAKIISKIK